MGIMPTSLGSMAAGASAGFTGSNSAAAGFAATLSTAIEKVNNLQSTAEQKVTDLLAGGGPEIHAATLSVERASLAFDLMLQVRNKVVSAYQEISRLQF